MIMLLDKAIFKITKTSRYPFLDYVLWIDGKAVAYIDLDPFEKKSKDLVYVTLDNCTRSLEFIVQREKEVTDALKTMKSSNIKAATFVI